LHGPPEARSELTRYLDDLAADGAPGKLSNRLHRKLPDLNRRIAEHFLASPGLAQAAGKNERR